ncbi:MAG TPA: hypothetical protein DEB25_07005 [Desulfobulbaceae bacterium]|nr:hypothetical protein [Desulfobulbaceae bacterium]
MMNAKQESKTFVFFLFCGGIAAVVELGGRWLVNFWLSYSAAIIIARLAGMLVAFLLFKFLVFKTAGSGRAQREGGWFVLINLLAMLQVWLVSVGLANYVFPWAGMNFHAKDIAHFIGVSTTALSSFIGHRLFTFKKEAK